MRKPATRVIAMLAAGVLAFAGCTSEDPAPTGEESQTQAATTEASETEEVTPAADQPEQDGSKVDSVETMVELLNKKHYDCKGWKQTDDVQGADASGTCNGEDQVMWFSDEGKVEAVTTQLDPHGTAYVVGDNWVVAKTTTPTLVRNALGGEAVAGK